MTDKEKKKLVKDTGMVAGGTGIAASPFLREKYLEKRKYDPKRAKGENRLLVVAEGGKNAIGGSGHETAAKGLVQAHEKKYGKGSAKVLYHNDHVYSSKLSKKTREAYNTMTSSDNTAGKRGKAAGKFNLLFPINRITKRKSLQKEIEEFNPSRTIATHPDSVNSIKKIGIQPEVMVTDYGVDNPGNRAFWNASRGWIMKGDNVSHAYIPSEQGESVLKEVKKTNVGVLPITSEFLSKDKKDIKTKKFTLNDNKGNAAGNIDIPEGKKMVAISGGSTGADVEKLVKETLKSNRDDFVLYTVTGKNEKLNNKLKDLSKKDKRLLVQGYEKDWKKVVDSSDLAILRPHGLTPTEVAHRGTPFISAVTNSKKGKMSDSYAPHMVGNAEHYKKLTGAPTAAITTDSSKETVKNVFEKTLDNLSEVKEKAQKASNNLLKNPAGKQVAEASNKTRFNSYKIPKPIKGGAILAGAGLGLYGAKDSLIKKK